MQWLLRVVCIGYAVFLTLLLLTSEPSRLIGVHGSLPWVLQKIEPAAHAISFLMLAVLVLAPRWPLPRWSIVLILIMYGGMTEIVQGFVPHRTPDWMDWAQDVGGVAAGAAICWAGLALCRQVTQSPQCLTTGIKPTMDD
jgi:VanZ family protein